MYSARVGTSDITALPMEPPGMPLFMTVYEPGPPPNMVVLDIVIYPSEPVPDADDVLPEEGPLVSDAADVSGAAEGPVVSG